MITKEFVNSVRARIAAHPETSTQIIAQDLQASEADVVMALPKAMRIRADNKHFDDIWQKLNVWDNTVLSLPGGHEGSFSTLCLALEHCTTQLDCKSGAKVSQKIICLQPRRTQAEWKEQLGSIWFVYQTYHGQESRSVRFYDKKGNRLFIASLESDSCSFEEALEYDEIRTKIGIITRPPQLGCGSGCGKGCGGCGKKASSCAPHTGNGLRLAAV